MHKQLFQQWYLPNADCDIGLNVYLDAIMLHV